MIDKKQIIPLEEQILYAAWLEKGMLVGLVLLIIAFVLYLFGVIAPVVPPEQLARYWMLPVTDYVAAINRDFLRMETVPVGWAWLALVSKGDFLNFLPIAFLSGITILCYLVILPVLVKKGDQAYVIISLAEILILVLAASGLLTTGH